jgi:hypothetical protein
MFYTKYSMSLEKRMYRLQLGPFERCAGCLRSAIFISAVWCLYFNDADSDDDCTYSTRFTFSSTKIKPNISGDFSCRYIQAQKILQPYRSARKQMLAAHSLSGVRTFAWHWGLSVRPTRGAGHFLCAMHSLAYIIRHIGRITGTQGMNRHKHTPHTRLGTKHKVRVPSHSHRARSRWRVETNYSYRYMRYRVDWDPHAGVHVCFQTESLEWIFCI